MAVFLSRRLAYVWVVSLLHVFIRETHSESYSSDNFEDKLGIAYEFKIHIDAGKEDCFYQYIQPSSSLYVAFQVRHTCLPLPVPTYAPIYIPFPSLSSSTH